MADGDWVGPAGDRLPVSVRDRVFVRDPETRWRLGVAVLALLGGLLVFSIATRLFPYHSLNHDEAVYLKQAEMLLDGRLFVHPPVPQAFRPWFFVESSRGMYPKYAPVPAAMFAPALALGVPRLALAAIGAALVALVIGLGAELFDRPTGLLAGVVLLASPLFLLNTSVFLPYAPTTVLNCAFALAYLRADRTGSRRLAAVAGGAVGLAFFARPYTALLFAAPFVAHALWTLRTGDRDVVVRQGIVAGLGLAGVAVALGYNAFVTGSALEFPYHAFAPRDGIGFGVHQLLGRTVEYTPELALRTNWRVLATYATDWVAAGSLGTLLALAGLALALRRRTPRRLALAGLLLTVPLGELYFWGTLNILGELTRPGDGLIAYLGPYYHFDLLVPTAIFAGLALRRLGGWLRSITTARFDRRQALAVSFALLTLGTVVGGAVAVSTVREPIDRNRDVTRHLEAAYRPFEETTFSNALVFLPEPYGPWLDHPFQSLRNRPNYDGSVVYALEERPLDVIEAFPNRTLYRYSYRNPWPPVGGDPVTPRLYRIRTVEGPSLALNVTAGVPQYAQLVSIRVESDAGHGAATVVHPGSELDVTLSLEDGRATLSGPALSEDVTVPYQRRDTIETSMYVDYETGAGFTYRVGLPVESRDGSVTALSPRLALCEASHGCGGAAAYVPSATRAGQSLNATLEAGG
ncbi:MAG: ArnT family glycosyltransferase [Halapricum sp.]